MAKKATENEVTNPHLKRRGSGPYADTGQVDASEKPILESPTGRDPERDPEDIRANTPLAERAPYRDVNARPLGEATASVPNHDRDDDRDGLNEMEQSIRRAAEKPVAVPDDDDEEEEDGEASARR